MVEPKQHYKLPPCPDYDIEAMESWLQDLALEGLFLEKEELFFGFLVFCEAAPQKVRYRLEPALKQQSGWNGQANTPLEDNLALYEEFGWEFLVKFREFFIYRSAVPAPRELHTEPELQASAMKVLKKRQLSNIFAMMVSFGIQAAFGIFRFPATFLLALGTPYTVLLSGFLLGTLVTPIANLFRLRKLQKRLLSGNGLDHHKNWRTGAKKHRAYRLCSFGLTLVLALATVGMWIHTHSKLPLEQLQEPVPFVMLEDLIPAGESVTIGRIDNGEYRHFHDILFPEVWDLRDGGNATYADGTWTAGLLEVQYSEARLP